MGVCVAAGPTYLQSEDWQAADRVLDPNQASSTGLEQAHFVQEPQRRSLRPPLAIPNIRRANTRGNFLVLRAFQEAIGSTWKSSVQIMSGGSQVALGAVVEEDGWIVTKASELTSAAISCRLFDGREFPASKVGEATDSDLALLRINADRLTPVNWDTALPGRGSWLATVDLKSTPRSVGVVSAGLQRVQAQSAVLGVNLTDSPKGAEVMHVLAGTGADQAGLSVGDSIFEVNGREVYSLRAFKEAIGAARGGEFVNLKVTRRDQTIPVQARLMDLTEELLDDTEMEVNGRVSARATGFKQVFLHDTVLEPEQCGGPLVNLDGRVVGLNIARAGRVTSYALPASVVKPAVDQMINSAKLVSHMATPDASGGSVR